MPPFDAAMAFEEHREALRRLARALVGDADAADDIVQDAFAAALVHRPEPSSLRFWLRAVVRRLAFDKLRRTQRRATRESAAARAEAVDADESLERLEFIEALAREVRELDEPFLTVIRLAYFDGLEQPEIAKRLNVPIETVRTRLKRARARLAERLDRRGGRERWLGAALAWVHPTQVPWMELALVKTKTTIGVAVTLAVAAWLGWRTFGPEAATDALAVVAPPPADPADRSPAPIAQDTVERSALVGPTDGTATSAESTVASGASLVGRVIDLQERPVAGVRVVARAERGGQMLGRSASSSDAAGCFELERPTRDCVLDVDTPAWTTVLEPWIGAGDAHEYTLVVAPRMPIQGRVVDPEGRPLSAAKIELSGRDVRSAIFADVTRSTNVDFHATSDATGCFSIDAAPDLWPGRLVTRRIGFLDDERELSSSDGVDSTIVLKRRPLDGLVVLGRVVGPRGEPIAGAHVRCDYESGPTSEPTNEFGEFELLSTAPVTEILALAPGYLPVRRVLDENSRNAPVEVRVVDPTQSIEGVVVDERGQPCGGLSVEVLDRQPIRDWRTRAGSVVHSLERLVAGKLPGAQDVVTDRDGRFEVSGLLPREYRLRLFDPETLASSTTTPIAAGSRELVLAAPAPDVRITLAGRVVDESGRPLANALVWVERKSDYAGASPLAGNPSSWMGARRHTDADGRFRFADVDGSAMRLVAAHGPYGMTRVELATVSDRESIEVVVERLCTVQIDLRGSGLDAEFALPCEDLAVTDTVVLPLGRATMSAGGVPIVDGCSPAFLVTTRVTTIELELAAGEDGRTRTKRLPVKLDPTRPNIVRP